MLDFALVALVGLVLGSFASALAWRAPRRISWFALRGGAEHSACPVCDHRLSWRDLFPLLSWLFLKGRCRYCGVGISIRYPLIELSTMMGCFAVYAAYGFTSAGFVMMAAMPIFAALIAIDFEHMILPDHLNAILAVLGFGFVATLSPQNLAEAMGAACLYAAMAWGLGWIMRHILKKEALGMGDVKFFAVAGVWLGLSGLPFFLVLSGIFGAGIGMFWKIFYRESLFPFGPALILALIVCRLLLPEIQSFGLISGGMLY